MNGTTFITTAIDYPNALPHIGTAFEKIGADAYARFRRSQGRDVYFLMGNDENTAKVVKAAENYFGKQPENKERQLYVDVMASQFKAVWNRLDISFDDFIQTTEERHKIGVQLFLEAVNKAGFIEKRPYKALYCEGCEEFKTPNGLVNNRCPNHQGISLIEREEENYFFLLSKFKQCVLDLLTSRHLSVEPQSRENEVRNFVETDLQDISISRNNEGWGIPIPWDESQVTYVWFDALLNYLTGIGFGTDWEKFEKYWPAEIHFIGKDITRFHCALFPAMIEAYNAGTDKKISMPQRVMAHGFIFQKKNDEWVKASKSGEAINPVDLIDKFGSDAYRYYFLSKFNYDADGEFSLEQFRDVYNSDLANNIGNLVSRVHGMSLQYFNGILPVGPVESNNFWIDRVKLNEYESFIINCHFRQALELIKDISTHANQYIEQMKPWDLSKTDLVSCGYVLRKLAGSLRIISLLLVPFLPTTSQKIYTTFLWTENHDYIWDYLKVLSDNNFLGIESGISVLNFEKFQPLFPRLEK